MKVEKYLKKAYSDQFKSYYGRKPTEEQLKVYMSFFLRKEDDMKKVSEVCQIPFRESFSSRESFKSNFKFIYDFEPTEEQLDMFISFGLCVVTDVSVVTQVCNTGSSKTSTGPSNE